ncbi:MAG TPA: outer membrane protein transport protein [Gemmataceae bacterium]|nr:outer membrane protein transport protein [Gemmataceae bacterium]
MLLPRPRLPILCSLAVGAALAAGTAARAELGFVLTGIGPVNRGMGVAGVAAPLDADGSLYWNPAAITGLGGSELDGGVELVIPDENLSSRLAPGSLGHGFPPVGLAGRTHGDTNTVALPAMGLVYQPEGSDLTFGLGIYEVGGFTSNYPASPTNPVLTAPPPRGIGLGPIYSQLQVFQIAPTIAAKLTDHLSVGVAPTIDLTYLQADPLIIATPNAFGNYPAGTHTESSWGAGVQAGAFYTTEAGWNFGASIKSPQWMQEFRFNATDLAGNPRSVKFHFDYPMIVSLGTAYTGIERWVFAVDVRYVNFHDTPGLSHSGFDATGALRGLGWEDVFAVSVGAQYQLTDSLTVRLGYSYNDSPIDNSQAFFNVASSTIINHSLAVGASYKVTQALILSMTYAHDFENTVSGPIVTPLGPIPVSSVKSQISADAVLVGATVKF